MVRKLSMTKGDIILISFPFTDLSSQKVRPSLVLYNNPRAEDCIVAFITSLKYKRLMPFDVRLVKSKTNGLKENSTLKLDRIVTLDKKLTARHIGKLESAYMSQVNKKLKQLFGL